MIYNGTRFQRDDDTLPLYLDTDMPRLPDIQANRDNWDIVSWDVQPGDALFFHPRTLHGGASTQKGSRRRTLALVFFGDDAVFSKRPEKIAASPDLIASSKGEQQAQFSHMKNGDAFRLPGLVQLKP